MLQQPQQEGAGPPEEGGLREVREGGADLTLLLVRGAARLRRSLGARSVAVVGRGPGGEARVLACDGEIASLWDPHGEPGRELDLALLTTLRAAPGAVDLGRPGAAEAERRAAARGWGAAVPLGRVGDEAWAALLLAGDADPPGGVRPRTLAALETAAHGLEVPAAATAAAARLGRLDDAVQRLHRLAALGDLVAEIAHEVRNPLVSVKTFLQLLPDRVDDPDFRVRFHAVVSDEVRRIERLLDAVLAHARPAAAAPDGEGADAETALRTVADLLDHRAMERGVEIAVEVAAVSGGSVRIPMAPDALRQVVLNLALNAVDAAPPGGRVTLRASEREAGAAAEVQVLDPGPGVAPELRERIFEPFFSTKPGRPGGLGLAISRRLVQHARGTLAVDDAPGGGARFRLRFPAR